jgi:hypothetical protein
MAILGVVLVFQELLLDRFVLREASLGIGW